MLWQMSATDCLVRKKMCLSSDEEEASRSKALVLMGDLICADGNTALNKQSLNWDT